ncbi:MAG: signal transduction histidine kinase/ligand-binding sensor domain-containing protein, partial [Phenylobacterium sp.]
ADSNSISNNLIRSLYQDKQGFIWLGTEGGGLNRFDPQTEQFKHFRHETSNPSSLSGDSISFMYEDHQQALWIGTWDDGLNKFDKQTENFTHFKHNSSNPHSLSNNSAKTAYKDHQNIMWFGSLSGGLNSYNAQTNQFASFKHNPLDPDSLGLNNIWIIYEDSQGRLWIGTDGGGLDRFDRKSQRFIHHRHDPHNSNSLSNNRIRTINEDANGILWIGTYGGGLNRFNPKTGQFSHFKHQASDPLSLNDNLVQSVLISTNGTIWVGTATGGINQYDTRKTRFGHFKHQPLNPNSLSHNNVNSIYQDDNNELWIGTNGGINRYDPKTQKLTHLQHQTSNPHSLSNNHVNHVLKDKKGVTWVSTYGSGLSRYDVQRNQFKHFRHDPSDPYSLSTDLLLTLYEDSAGQLWLGGYGSGLNRFERRNQQFNHFKYDPSDPHSLNNNDVTFIYEDKTSLLWIGTRGGLNQYNEQTGHFRHFTNQLSNPHSLSHNDVTAIYQDARNTLWIGTMGGLNKYDSKSNQFKHYREKDGLANDSVMGILEDRTGHLWLSTNKGLSRFNPLTEQFRNFTADDGLQSNQFNPRAAFKGSDGELFFGGINGFNRFYPESIIDDSQPPTVVLTDFQLDNQSVLVKPGAKESEGSLGRTINDTASITLTHQQNLMSFTFAALNFSSPMKSQYAYQLQGWDEKWFTSDAKNRRATYTNIPSGDYTLRVKASNSDGYWNTQDKSLHITILPPPWQTWWAYTLYVMVVTALLLLVIYIVNERRKGLNERTMLDQLKQVDKIKDEFLANTSHELRTPLNGIIGLAESLMDGVTGQLSPQTNQQLAMVVSSGRRLSNLINDILDFAKLESHTLTLHAQPVNLHNITDVVLALSQHLVGDKKLTLINNISEHLPAVEADEERLQQILYNLIGNGVKFTEQGSIEVSAQQHHNRLIISVTDSGIGIAENQFDEIFESFKQVQGSATRRYGGTGLGLAVSKELIALHGSQIEVTSTPGKGSTFSFSLPISDGKPLANSTTNQAMARLQSQQLTNATAQANPVLSTMSPSNDGSHGFRLLLVDDEPINRLVLRNHLSQHVSEQSEHSYHLTEAAGGEEALRALEQDGPFDLVLLDVMMPIISGYEVCETLRKTWSVNELPVIFLTAKNQQVDVVHSFAVGGNDFLSKPVAKHELLARVETHLKLLDINRSLEDKVAQRTEALQQSADQLEQKNREIIEAQQQMVKSETMASLGTLTAGVAHEINNPTNFVNISSQNLEVDLGHFQQFLIELAGPDADEDVLTAFEQQFEPLYGHLNTIQNGTERIKTIIQDLRSFSKLTVADKKSVRITDLLQSTIHLIKTNYFEITTFVSQFEFEQTPEPELLCYPAELNQVFMNLIVNACDAIKEQQHTSQSKTLGQITIGCRQLNIIDKPIIEVTIKDTGSGMTQETKGKLFEPFYTTKDADHGTGLGLSISFNIVQKHQGELLVESALGVGTTFTVRLPLT